MICDHMSVYTLAQTSAVLVQGTFSRIWNVFAVILVGCRSLGGWNLSVSLMLCMIVTFEDDM